jgi:Protein of unknown function (DUF2637)
MSSGGLPWARWLALRRPLQWRHISTLTRWRGHTARQGGRERPVPLTVEGLIYASSMLMLDSARRKAPVPSLARWLLGLGIAATLAANVAHGLGHGPIGAAVAAWPAIALVGSYELLMMSSGILGYQRMACRQMARRGSVAGRSRRGVRRAACGRPGSLDPCDRAVPCRPATCTASAGLPCCRGRGSPVKNSPRSGRSAISTGLIRWARLALAVERVIWRWACFRLRDAARAQPDSHTGMVLSA